MTRAVVAAVMFGAIATAIVVVEGASSLRQRRQHAALMAVLLVGTLVGTLYLGASGNHREVVCWWVRP